MRLTDTQQQIRELLYNHGPIQRFTQDSPVLPDVWLAFAKDPSATLDLLLTPFQSSTPPVTTPGELRKELNARLGISAQRTTTMSSDASGAPSRQLAYNESVVAVKLTFEELIFGVIPVTAWWIQHVASHNLADKLKKLSQPANAEIVAELLTSPPMKSPPSSPISRPDPGAAFEIGLDVLWFIRVVGTIVLIKQAGKTDPPPGVSRPDERLAYFRRLVAAVAPLFERMKDDQDQRALVFVVNINREASVTIWRSSLAIKADAARQLFSLKCDHLAWAVIDSGVDATHPSFRVRDVDGRPKGLPAQWQECSRVVRTYDFTMIRDLLSEQPTVANRVPENVRKFLRNAPDLRPRLMRTIDRIQHGLDIDWGLVLPLIEIRHADSRYQTPTFEHGTHVAGIIGSNWNRGEENNPEQAVVGVCPDIQLYDFRVLNHEGRGDEFNVIAALQAVRYINSQKSMMTIHGVNISLAIPHQVLNYACGRTPICDEAERLWQSGVVVVAAAGNRGYDRDESDSAQAYRSISITDPGNAERLITVGATHRDMPHTYGVSFFSSRGPTGDGRAKPDIVAPGEKISSCVPGKALRRLDGTSMAAPHVSGAAALLMARHAELMGNPDRIKKVLCETATDLGREHYFQGHGMLDVLRALQSV